MNLRLLAVVLVLGALGASADRVQRVRESFRTREGAPSLAYFEAFPASGAGTTTACSTTAPTGAKGEVLTFTRASNGTCTKTASGGLATTGIADGDLVVLANNVARVEYDSAGTLGLLVEAARTNDAIRSEEFENVAWTPYKDGAASLPVVSGTNVAVAPDGATTAEQIDFGATIAGQSSIVYQAVCTVAQQCAVSFYVKGVSGSGTIDVCAGTSGASCVACAYVSTSWTRCIRTGVAGTANTAYIGNATFYNGGTARSAQSVYVWGGQVEDAAAAAYATSYIPTAGVAVARAADAPTFTLPAFTLSAPFSIAASVQLPTAIPALARLHGSLGPTGLATYIDSYYASSTTLKWLVDSTQVTPNGYDTGLALTAEAVNRVATYHDGTTFNGCVGGTCAAGVARAWSDLASVTTYRPGMYNTTAGVVDGIVTRICISNTDATRCR